MPILVRKLHLHSPTGNGTIKPESRDFKKTAFGKHLNQLLTLNKKEYSRNRQNRQMSMENLTEISDYKNIKLL